MMTPAARPEMTENDSPSQLSMPSRYRMANVAPAIRMALTLVPTDSERSRSFMVAPSLVRTRNMPSSDRNTPTAAISIGAMTARSWISSPATPNAAAPKAAVDSTEPQ